MTPLQTLKSITFAYDRREDRILAATNAGAPDAWSCWLTRRIVLLLLERASGFLANTSTLVRRGTADMRGELAAFEREAAMANTAKAMRRTPDDVLKSSGATAELVQRLTFSGQGAGFRFELRGERGGGADGTLTRAEFQRILQMLQAETSKAGWLMAKPPSEVAPPAEQASPKPFRH